MWGRQSLSSRPWRHENGKKLLVVLLSSRWSTSCASMSFPSYGQLHHRYPRPQGWPAIHQVGSSAQPPVWRPFLSFSSESLPSIKWFISDGVKAAGDGGLWQVEMTKLSIAFSLGFLRSFVQKISP
jgi:hypothetical protein